jgi:hypothetical protein
MHLHVLLQQRTLQAVTLWLLLLLLHALTSRDPCKLSLALQCGSGHRSGSCASLKACSKWLAMQPRHTRCAQVPVQQR